MIENGKTKAGDKDYFSKYKKYSIYDYTNLIVKNFYYRKNELLIYIINFIWELI